MLQATDTGQHPSSQRSHTGTIQGIHKATVPIRIAATRVRRLHRMEVEKGWLRAYSWARRISSSNRLKAGIACMGKRAGQKARPCSHRRRLL
jgi:hypothetical protein